MLAGAKADFEPAGGRQRRRGIEQEAREQFIHQALLTGA
jgi:hypothetical protein